MTLTKCKLKIRFGRFLMVAGFIAAFGTAGGLELDRISLLAALLVIPLSLAAILIGKILRKAGVREYWEEIAFASLRKEYPKATGKAA